MENQKKHHLYVLYDVETLKPIYIGLSCNLRNRIYKHEQSKKFDGVHIVESFECKKEGLAAERAIIKFLSLFQFDTIVNSLNASLVHRAELNGFFVNQIKKIKNGRLD
jgi:predicted GIY-YIG superfamily endonuclease